MLSIWIEVYHTGAPEERKAMTATPAVTIVGAGPVGLALACELNRWNITFRIVDRKAEPEVHSKAANFWPRTQEVAVAMGFGQRVIDQAVRIHGQTLVAYGKLIGHPPIGPFPSPYGDVLAINQGTIEQTLLAYLKELGVHVEYGTTATLLSQDDNGVECELVNAAGKREILRSAYLVACDGSHSTIRAAVGLGITPTLIAGAAFRQIDARLRWSRPITHDHLFFFLAHSGFGGVVPLPGGYYRYFVVEDEQRVPRRLPTTEEMQESLRTLSGDVQAEWYEPVWYSHGRLQYGVARQFQQSRVLLAGDAGHMTIPIGGQGMNTGIQDAFNLGWKLAAVLHNQSPPALLETYSQERQPLRQALAEDQARNAARLIRPHWWQHWATTLIGPLVLRQNRSVELGRSDDTQLSVHYRDSPLTADYGRGSGVRAGDRAPDAPVVVAVERRSTTLFREIYQTRWTLLAFDSGADTRIAGDLGTLAQELSIAFPTIRPRLVLAHPSATRWAVGTDILFDVDRSAHTAYGITRPTFLLVRPDGYIAVRCDLGQCDALWDYCCTWHQEAADARTPLVLIPGAGCTRQVWAAQIAGVQDLARPIVLENRQHASAEALIAAALPKLPARFALAGFSQGGLLALELMCQAPERVTRLALIDTMARPEPAGAATRHRLAILLAALRQNWLIERMMWPKLVHAERQRDTRLRAIIRLMLSGTGTQGIINQQRIFLSRPDYRPLLPTIRTPTVVIVGDGDTFTPAAAAEEIVRLIPDARLAVVSGAGHMAPLEASEAVTALLRTWLADEPEGVE
jgi:3-(3-hydroxy-phenyl)propionate hydroxylase